MAFAQDAPADGDRPKKDPSAVFRDLDKNKDGKVSKTEFMANKKGEWAAENEKTLLRKARAATDL